MKNIRLSLLILGGLIYLTGCASRKNSAPTVKGPENSTIEQSVSAADPAILRKKTQTSEYTHEMAEADADDQKIQKTLGVSDIDNEQQNEVEDLVRTRNFLSLKKTKRMEFWVDYFTNKNHERFQRFINNGEEYRPIIEKIFESHGLPKELYFVGLIESGYYLGARSHASAVGPWQFIKGTGKRYGLKITNELDERQDLFKASEAAAMYFKDLYNVFSSWELALAAYNAGEYGIIRRIMQHGTRDFYELSRNKQLPSETINYVPKVLAAMHVVKNAHRYGFNIPKKSHRLFDLTRLAPMDKNTSLKTVARRLNVDPELLRKLNPELKQNKTPRYYIGTYYLRVPESKHLSTSPILASDTDKQKGMSLIPNKPETKKELNRRTAQLDLDTDSVPQIQIHSAQKIIPSSHVVKKGETLISISRRYNISPGKIAKINQYKSWRTNLKAGQRIKIQETESRQVAIAKKNEPKVKITNSPVVYEIQRGDNLTQVAQIFSTSVKKIKQVNNLKNNGVFRGQKIIIPNSRKGIYVVRRGDHLKSVAKKLDQSFEAMVKLNDLKKKNIYPGQKLIVNMD